MGDTPQPIGSDESEIPAGVPPADYAYAVSSQLERSRDAEAVRQVYEREFSRQFRPLHHRDREQWERELLADALRHAFHMDRISIRGPIFSSPTVSATDRFEPGAIPGV